MPRYVIAFVMSIMVLAGCGGGSGGDGSAPPLMVSAASSLKTALTAYGGDFSDAVARFSFAGSDELAAQIEQGVKPDVFASANTKLPDALFAKGLVEKPVVFAANRLVLAVPKDSKITSVAEVDRDGVRIGVSKNSAYDLYLTRTLKHATLMRGDDGIALFVKEKLDAAGGVKQPLVAYAKTNPNVKILDGRFMEIRQAMGTPKGRGEAGARYLGTFIEEMKASGFVADALKRSNQPDAAVAPPAT